MLDAEDTGTGALADVRHEIVDALFDESLSAVPTRPPVILAPSTPIGDTIRAMNAAHVGCALVVDGGKLVGIFTERDVLTRVAGRKLNHDTTPVAEVMTRDPDALPASATVAFALRQMIEEGYRNIPLVDGGVPVGVVSVRDVVAWLCDLFPEGVLNLPPSPGFPATSEDGG